MITLLRKVNLRGWEVSKKSFPKRERKRKNEEREENEEKEERGKLP